MAFSFTDSEDDGVMSEINMTPLVDVMLVLLIVFMVTIPVMHHAVPVQLPQASSTPEKTPTEPLRLGIAADGKLLLNGATVNSEVLSQQLKQAAAQQPQPALQIHADKQAAYDHVAKALASARQAGLTQVGFVMEPK